MTAEEAVLERNLSALSSDRPVILINPPTESARALLNAAGYSDIQSFSQYARPELTASEFGLQPTGKIHQAVWFLPRERLLREWLATALESACVPDALVLAIGENQAGAKSAPRQLSGAFQSIEKVDSARHCTAYLCQKPQSGGEKALPETVFPVSLGTQQLEAVTLPGVFSHGHLDHGTRLLLDHLPDLNGEVLDFGCGCGVIAAAIAKRTGADLTVSDISALALEATRRTFVRNALQPPRFELCSDLPEGQWDAIVTNPPFHDGIHTQYDTARRMIESAPAHLTSRGRLIVVANTHLGYPSLMNSVFRQVDVLAQSRRFIVLDAQK